MENKEQQVIVTYTELGEIHVNFKGGLNPLEALGLLDFAKDILINGAPKHDKEVAE